MTELGNDNIDHVTVQPDGWQRMMNQMASDRVNAMIGRATSGLPFPSARTLYPPILPIRPNRDIGSMRLLWAQNKTMIHQGYTLSRKTEVPQVVYTTESYAFTGPITMRLS